MSDNHAAAARFIRERGQATQADIGAALELDKSTVSRLLVGLAERRLVRAVTELPAASRGGRKTVVWELDPEGPRAIAVALDHVGFEVAVMGLDGRLTARRGYSTPENGAHALLLPALERAVRQALADTSGQVVGVGVASPGIVDGRTGTVLSCVHMPGLRDLPLAARLDVGLPVFVNNNARLALTAELCYGAARGKRHVVCLFADYGLGLATASDGKLFQGANGLANDFHVAVDPRGPKCHCGRAGCVETLVGGRALIDRLALPEIHDVESLCRAAVDGLPAAVEALETAGFWLGREAAHLRGIFDPETIVLAGALAQAGDVLLNAMRKAYAAHLIDSNYAPPPLIAAALGRDCALTGAGVVGLTPLFGE